jgi:hypothetical protein
MLWFFLRVSKQSTYFKVISVSFKLIAILSQAKSGIKLYTYVTKPVKRAHT